ncbi:hypothetical protein AnigIFM63309_011175 [Aspergillus niger]|nr:hypothetical protein AnigIFM63309_011175 [Aspergillus niger]
MLDLLYIGNSYPRNFGDTFKEVTISRKSRQTLEHMRTRTLIVPERADPIPVGSTWQNLCCAGEPAINLKRSWL